MQTEVVVERPLPESAGYCMILHGLLSREVCASLVAEAERRGFVSAEPDYPPTYRNNARQVHDDAALAETLLARARPHLPETCVDADGAARLYAVNPRFRLCRYAPGQRFGIHQDGVRHESASTRSMLTFMIYLTDAEQIEGGDTVFYDGPGRVTNPPREIARVRPRAGSLIVFDHRLWHAGDTVTRGIKHVLRSDLLYRQAVEAATARAHKGYVFTLERLASGRVVSGGRDGTIRLDGDIVGAHAQSVLGLASLDATHLASVSRDRTVSVWDLAQRTRVSAAHAHEGAALAIARIDARTFATGGADHTIAIFGHDARLVCRLRGHGGWVWSLAMHARTLVSASEDGTVALWDPASRALGMSIPLGVPLRSVCVRGARIAVGAYDGTVSIIRARDGARLRRFRAHVAAVRRVRFLSDGRIATAGEDDAVRVWTEDGVLLAEHALDAFATDVIEIAPWRLRIAGYDGLVRDIDLASCREAS